jgi:hypothetical protein
MQDLLAKCDSLAIRATSSAAFSFLVIPAAAISAAAIACWLVPTVAYRPAKVTRYELRYVDGVGNVEFPAGTTTSQVREYSWLDEVAAQKRLRYFLPIGLLSGIAAGAFLHRRSRRLYRNGRKLYLEDGDLLPITGEPMQGELLPPIRTIGLQKSAADIRTIVNQS